MRITIIQKGDIGMDCYYHVRMATMPLKNIAGKIFPSMTLSLWEKKFSNKELLFHIVLKSIQIVTLNKDPKPPFHIHSFFLLLFFTVSFVYTANSLGIKHIWIYAMGLFLFFPLLTMRILYIRPHVFAMSFICVALGLYYNLRERKHLWIPFLSGFIFAWTYSSPHFIMTVAFMAGSINIFQKRYLLAILIISLTFLGLLAGMTFHPQFPNTFYIWYIQAIQVASEMVSGSNGIFLGSELTAPNKTDILANICQYIILTIDLVLLHRLYKNKKLNVSTISLFLFAFFWGILFFFAKRAIEYSAFATVLASGVIITDSIKAGLFNRFLKYKNKFLVICVCLILILIPFAYNFQKRELSTINRFPFSQFSAWAKKTKLPEGTVIANLYWSDFPRLFFSTYQYRYLYGIDPMFAYFIAPEKVLLLQEFSADRIKLLPEKIKKITGSDFLFISTEYRQMSKKLFSNGYKLIYQGMDGCLFKLTE